MGKGTAAVPIRQGMLGVSMQEGEGRQREEARRAGRPEAGLAAGPPPPPAGVSRGNQGGSGRWEGSASTVDSAPTQGSPCDQILGSWLVSLGQGRPKSH